MPPIFYQKPFADPIWFSDIETGIELSGWQNIPKGPMAITLRSFSAEQDKYQMAALARQCPERNLHVTDLPYRLSSWALDDPENIGLWFDENGRLVAWAALQTPFWTVDYVCHPEAEPFLHRQILIWADERARVKIQTANGRPAWFIMVFSGQTDRIRDLESAGYTCQSNHSPDYMPELDLVVESPDKRLVAFCICWFDVNSIAGQVEPLGSHKDFRPYALGRVVLSEGLHRLQLLGSQNIYVETDSYRNTAFRLYESFDFEVIQDVLVYRKDY